MRETETEIVNQLSEHVETTVEPSDLERNFSGEQHKGDIAYPAMEAAKKAGEPPRKLAERIAREFETGNSSYVQKVEAAGPGYVNFYLGKKKFGSRVVETLDSNKMSVRQEKSRTLVEFASPNVAKPMHVGHLRNIAVGDSLQRILSYRGHEVVSENYLGDWGTQYGKLIYAFKNWGSMESFEAKPMEHMYHLYKKFHEEAEQDESIKDEAQNWAAKIEDGDEEARSLWRMFREASIEHHNQVFNRLNVEFDRITGESEVQKQSKQMVENWISENQISRDEDGSVFMEFENRDIPGTVILKEDDSTLYITRDIYNLKKRNEEGFDQNLYVVASEQDLHFKQVFAAADQMGLDTTGAEHVSYGMISLPEGSMSSRTGNIVTLTDVLDEAESRAKNKSGQTRKNPEKVGLAAVKYANLEVSRSKNIEFDWESALSIEGDSGPYLQYSNVRAKSILEEASVEPSMAAEPTPKAYSLLKLLSQFPEKVEKAAEEREPAKLANYLSRLSEQFNTFYHSCPVLESELDTMKTRLVCVNQFINVTDKGMELLGIEPLNKM